MTIVTAPPHQSEDCSSPSTKLSPMSSQPDLPALLSALSIKAHNLVNRNAALRSQNTTILSENETLRTQRNELLRRVTHLEGAMAKQRVAEAQITESVKHLSDIFDSASATVATENNITFGSSDNTFFGKPDLADSSTLFGKPNPLGVASPTGTTSFQASPFVDVASRKGNASALSPTFGAVKPFTAKSGDSPPYDPFVAPPGCNSSSITPEYDIFKNAPDSSDHAKKTPSFSVGDNKSSTKPSSQTDTKNGEGKAVGVEKTTSFSFGDNKSCTKPSSQTDTKSDGGKAVTGTSDSLFDGTLFGSPAKSNPVAENMETNKAFTFGEKSQQDASAGLTKALPAAQTGAATTPFCGETATSKVEGARNNDISTKKQELHNGGAKRFRRVTQTVAADKPFSGETASTTNVGNTRHHDMSAQKQGTQCESGQSHTSLFPAATPTSNGAFGLQPESKMEDTPPQKDESGSEKTSTVSMFPPPRGAGTISTDNAGNNDVSTREQDMKHRNGQENSSLFPEATPLSRGTFGLQPLADKEEARPKKGYSGFKKRFAVSTLPPPRSASFSYRETCISGEKYATISLMPFFDSYCAEEIRLWDYVNSEKRQANLPLAAK